MTDDFFRNRLHQMIDLPHSLKVLANPMPWQEILASYGNGYFGNQFPFAPKQLGRLSKAFGEEAVEELLDLTMEVEVKPQLIAKKELTRVIMYSNLHEKAVAHPTDNKLLAKSISTLGVGLK